MNRRRQPDRIDLLEAAIAHLHRDLRIIMAAIDDLTAAVARDTDVDASAITLLNGLKAQLDAAIAAGDPAALQALSDQLGTNASALADAVSANTPAAADQANPGAPAPDQPAPDQPTT